MSRVVPPVGFKPRSLWSEDCSVNHSATRTLQMLLWIGYTSKRDHCDQCVFASLLRRGCTLPALNLDMSPFANGVTVKIQKQNGKQCRSWWDDSSWAVSSGSTLFAKVSVFDCMAEGVQESAPCTHRCKVVRVAIFEKESYTNIPGKHILFCWTGLPFIWF